jgi:ADP-dependent NAD(P)H-hydrate dehydratase / NAD(P)H-hydrate epimerase
VIARLVDPAWLPTIGKARDAHKYQHGHALVMAGGPGQGGAARLAARAALRVGAGAVTLLCPQAAMVENAARLDAIMLSVCDRPHDLASKMADPRVTALCLGPAMGLGLDKAELLGAALAMADDTAMVLDADALTHLARDPSLRAAVRVNTILTPHAGEFARLFPKIAAELAAPPNRGPAYSKLDAVRAAAEQIGCTVLLKGADTVIATPDGQVALNAACYDRAVPWLATAGAGDVLAGLICGLLARGFSPFHAACWGAWLHAESAGCFGPGLIAEDLPEMLPRVLAQLNARV